MAVLGSDNISHSGNFKINVNSADRVTVDTSGRFLAGTSSALPVSTNTPQFQFAGAAGQPEMSVLIRGANAASQPAAYFLRSRGTLSSPTAVVNSDFIGSILFEGFDGTNPVRGAAIQAFINGTPGANVMPGGLLFATTPPGEQFAQERMRITSGGNLLVRTTDGLQYGSTTPASLVVQHFGGVQMAIKCISDSTSVSGQIRFVNPNGEVGSISSSGSATSFNTSSDYRLKENVVDLDGAIDRLKQLPVHRFNFIVEPEITVDGFIAHEAQEVVPECATGTKDEMRTAKNVVLSSDGKILCENIKIEDWESGKIPNEDDESTYPVDSTWTEEYEVPVYQGIDQSKLVPLLTAALQEAIKRIETLEAKVLELEAS